MEEFYRRKGKTCKRKRSSTDRLLLENTALATLRGSHQELIPGIQKPVCAMGRHMVTKQQKVVRVKRLSLAQRLIRNALRLVDLTPRSRRLQRIGRRGQTLEVFPMVLLRL